jgi:DNA topoisomerase II
VDGLTPAQRKVLFCSFKKNLYQELKVAQLAGYVAEHSANHHGEVNLGNTTLKMAQYHIGSNNLNLLIPSGQFGTCNMVRV